MPHQSILAPPSPAVRRNPIHSLFVAHVDAEPFCSLGPVLGGGELETNGTETAAALLGGLCVGKTDDKHITPAATVHLWGEELGGKVHDWEEARGARSHTSGPGNLSEKVASKLKPRD